MPEIKHNFTGGKMNKDLDERVVPNGEYRDALNIQVSTSEGSDVGAVQNILGNLKVEESLGYYPDEPNQTWTQNTMISNSTAGWGLNSKCVGAISDEKQDTLYWFVSCPQDWSIYDVQPYPWDLGMAHFISLNQLWFSHKDMILRYTEKVHSVGWRNGVSPVFVDCYETWTKYRADTTASAGQYAANLSNYIVTTELPISHAAHTDQWVVTNLSYGAAGIIDGMTVEIADPSVISGPIWTTTIKNVTWAGVAGEDVAQFEFVENPPFVLTPAYHYRFTKPRILELPNQKLITGINIIDDMLFWTTALNEPKKINIRRSLLGTHPSGDQNTKLVNTKTQADYDADIFTNSLSVAANLNVYPKIEDVTVIKKSPKRPPCLRLIPGRDPALTHTAVMRITSSFDPPTQTASTPLPMMGSGIDNPFGGNDYDFSGTQVGDTIFIEFIGSINTYASPSQDDGSSPFYTLNWNVGDTVVIKEFDSAGNPPDLPITDYRLKGIITMDAAPSGAIYSQFTQPNIQNEPCRIAVRITSIDGFPPQPSDGHLDMLYAVDLLDETEKLFEHKFPRFAYRWKYEDNEYSCFSPFTEVAFLPGSFDFHPKKGYNLGMTNRVAAIDIDNFVTSDMPEDVVEIDLLYKDEQSPNIYVVATINPNDSVAVGVNAWNKNSYTVSTETIYAVLPSNQLLRPWDNVPKKALAQDVTGNRVVYANYKQNYNLTTDILGTLYFPEFLTSIGANITQSSGAVKSIKSLREYQVGVVFIDEYGRETPVISNTSGTFKLPKSNAPLANRLDISFNGTAIPKDMTYFKFFIKETSGEYYNMAMDRFYDAADGNIWLSFASSDRNKLDIDTFLILKKGLDNTMLVTEPARYKVLAIESDAPDFIKTTKVKIVEDVHLAATNNIFGSGMGDAPGLGDSTFSVNYAPFHMTSGSKLHEIDKGQLWVEFGISGENEVSDRYRISELTCDWDGQASTINTSKYHFKLKDQFGEDVNFISDDPTGLSATQINDLATIKIYQYIVENRPEFDGKFFVKILNDDTFQKYINKVYQSFAGEFRVVGHKTIYSLKDVKSSHSATSSYDIFKGNSPPKISGSNFNGTPGSGCYPDMSPFHDLSIDCTAGYKWHFWSWFVDWKYDSIDYIDYVNQYNENKSSDTWFIDSGTYKGRSFGNDYDPIQVTPWNPSGETTTGSGSYGIGGSNYQTPDYTGTGIDSTTSTDFWTIDLGFGGIWSDEWILDRGRAGCTTGSNLSDDWITTNTPTVNSLEKITLSEFRDNQYPPIPEFFNIGRSGGNVNYTAESATVEKLIPGQKFRFREDPQGTVYEILPSVVEENRVRYRRNDEDDNSLFGNGSHIGGGYSTTEDPGNIYTTPYIDHPSEVNSTAEWGKIAGFTNASNFTKNWIIKAEPMIQWDPTLDDGSGYIPIANGGREIILTTPTVSEAPTIAYNHNLQMDDHYIVLTSILATDTQTGESVTLVPGYALYSYNNTPVFTHTSHSEPLLVKKIEFDSATGMYHVYLCGSLTVANTGGWTGISNSVLNNNETLTFRQPSLTGLSPQFVDNLKFQYDDLGETLKAVGYTIEFIEPISDVEIAPDDPAIWETEPKDTGVDMNIYYEASGANPISPHGLVGSTISHPTMLPGTLVTGSYDWIVDANDFGTTPNPSVNQGNEAVVLQINPPACVYEDPGSGACASAGLANITSFANAGGHAELLDQIADVHYCDLSIEISIAEANLANIGIQQAPNGSNYIAVNEFYLQAPHTSLHGPSTTFNLNWFNCWSFGNGVESNRIRDNFNLPYLTNGVKVSATLSEPYKEEHRKYGLIYSGIYNSVSGVNNLNQFIQAEKITKDINPIYGSIQKLFSRDTDLVTICEDKVLKILANKDAVFNADGNPNLTATENVLGQTIPFSGEYGISTDPASFASESYRAYFSDKVRGSIIRLSRDGITPISSHGMKDWFRDHLKLMPINDSWADDKDRQRGALQKPAIIGTYDDRQDEFNIHLTNHAQEFPSNHTVTFREDVRGWVSFKSFLPEHGISMASNYYTFKNGYIYKHHEKRIGIRGIETNYCEFYGFNYPSSITVLLNDMPGIVKSYNTLNYEGSQTAVTQNLVDDQYFNLSPKVGWYVDSIKTDMQEGSLAEFIEKEGKWFNYIKGRPVGHNQMGTPITGWDSDSFAIQGLGNSSGNVVVVGSVGCTDPIAFNYDQYAATACYDEAVPPVENGYTNISAVCCVPIIPGCLMTSATGGQASNYNCPSPQSSPIPQIACPSQGPAFDVNQDDGSCQWYGCTDSTATNYDDWATLNDGSCIATVLGCTDSTAFNYNPAANTEHNPSDCYPFIYGCMDPLANNFWESVGNGVTGDTSIDVNSPCDDNNGSGCVGGQTGTNCCCTYTVPGCTDDSACNYDPTANLDDGSCYACGPNIGAPIAAIATNYDANANCDTVVPALTQAEINATCTTCYQLGNWYGLGTILGDLTYTSPTGSTSIEVTWTAYGDDSATGYGPGTMFPDWGMVTQPDYYEVRWSSDGGTTWTTSGNISNNANSFTITNLTPATSYEIEARSCCPTTGTGSGAGCGTWYDVTDTGGGGTGGPSTGGVLGCMDNGPSGTNNNGGPFTGVNDYVFPDGVTTALSLVPSSNIWGACNYNPLATIHDQGSCEYSSCVGCTASGYFDYVGAYNPPTQNINQPASQVAIDNGLCPNGVTVVGCTNSNALNYDPGANTACTGCCCLWQACTDICATNYDATCAADPDCCNTGAGGCDYGLMGGGNTFTQLMISQESAIPYHTDYGGSNDHDSLPPPPSSNQTGLDAEDAFQGSFIWYNMWMTGDHLLSTQASSNTVDGTWLTFYTPEPDTTAYPNGPADMIGDKTYTGAGPYVREPVALDGIDPWSNYFESNVVIFPHGDHGYHDTGNTDPADGNGYDANGGWNSSRQTSYSGVGRRVSGLIDGTSYEIRITVNNLGGNYTSQAPFNIKYNDASIAVAICDSDWTGTDSMSSSNLNYPNGIGSYTQWGAIGIMNGCILTEPIPGNSAQPVWMLNDTNWIPDPSQDTYGTGKCTYTCPDGITWSHSERDDCSVGLWELQQYQADPINNPKPSTPCTPLYNNSSPFAGGFSYHKDGQGPQPQHTLTVPFTAFAGGNSSSGSTTSGDHTIYIVYNANFTLGSAVYDHGDTGADPSTPATFQDRYNVLPQNTVSGQQGNAIDGWGPYGFGRNPVTGDSMYSLEVDMLEVYETGGTPCNPTGGGSSSTGSLPPPPPITPPPVSGNQTLYSDRRLKKNIKKIGESPSGLNIYSFEYKSKAFGIGTFQGVISDELPRKFVSEGSNGWETVDYSKIDVEYKRLKK